ncbi:MAG: restriction endonuclease subunit S [Muribaculaceae bacterium]|nr:restriction endonuclease subunit S [Muribaculaceae bacterium]
MGEIGKFFNGLTGKSKADFINGNARFISYMNIYSNIALNQSANEFVRILPNEKQNILQYGDALFTGSSETPDECGMSSVVTTEPKEALYLNSFSFGFRLDNISIYHPDFLKHLLRSQAIRAQIAKTANGVTRFNVSKALFAKVVLPIPPIELQVKIANILDRFETLVNDLTQGLPAEIVAEKERYEYYRNRLLSFKQLSA